MYLHIIDPDHDRHGETGQLVEKPSRKVGPGIKPIRIDAAIFQVKFPDGTKTSVLSSQIQVVPFAWRDLSG